MKAYAIPKDKQAVALRFKDARTVKGTIFLERLPQRRSLHEMVSGFLEDTNRFFPFLADEKTMTEFISKNTVWAVEIDLRGQTDDENFERGLIRIQEITALLSDGTSIKGGLMAEVPEEQSRLSDCLNLKERFMSLKVDTRIVYVNKDRVRMVMPAGDRD